MEPPERPWEEREAGAPAVLPAPSPAAPAPLVPEGGFGPRQLLMLGLVAGALVLVGLLVGQLTPLNPPVNAGPLIMGRRAIMGSLIGGMPETQEVLDFCAEHGISCDIEMLDIRKINEAYERMERGDVRYRFVIDMETLRAG